MHILFHRIVEFHAWFNLDLIESVGVSGYVCWVGVFVVYEVGVFGM